MSPVPKQALLHTPAPSDAREEMTEREPDGDKQAAQGEGDEDKQSQGEEQEYPFKRLVKHRWVGDSMEIRVDWGQGEFTWEPETNLHADALQNLLQYWVKQGGRPTNPTDAGLFNIFAVRQHSPDRKRLLVEWVGYSPKENSWVSCRAVEETAPEVVAEYWKTVQPRRRPGRPRVRPEKKNKS
ncbi:hypothetical protein HRG_000007 [Hirsutella rhossiliensis]|uniref:Chromo domain-containing protein n=1 Tax=Hirsutella rhossiliensis TaxID=111463 RepID=A0A9P8N5L4_9HYPO|nr:uncharacterized protein HRG_00007 [Hirsutella rhossiliensis]KAH0967365.1 hypothetical protein HRG_00007 [Hirsutella rhossiliensis]